MDTRALREALDAYAASRLPADADLWPAIRGRVRTRPRRPDTARPPAPTNPAGPRDRIAPPIAMSSPRRLATLGANLLGTICLLAVVALVLAFVLSGMSGRRAGGLLGPAGTPAPPAPNYPFPVPADCPITPPRGPEARDGFTGYWIEDNGIALGIADGVLYQGLTEARADVEITDASGRRGTAPPIRLNLYGQREGLGPGAIWFPDPGCWTIEARGRADWRAAPEPFTITVYVYPIACPHRPIPGADPGPIGPSLPCRPPEATP